MTPKPTPAQVYTTNLPQAAISFDVEAFDRAIRSQGVTFVHWRGMRCPVGMVDQFDTRRPHEDHSGCSNGFIYTRAGKITCLFTGNTTNTSTSDAGHMDGSTVQITLPRFYDDSEQPVYIAPFDRLYLDEEDIVVVHWQLYEHGAAGKDKLSFPVATVQDLVDNENNRYAAGDYEIVGGQVAWLSQKRPGLDPETGRGRICAIRYTYRPYWYVKSLPHEVRVTQAANEFGIRTVKRMPQYAVIQREFIFEKEEKDEQAPDPESPRQVKSPASGLFGAR